MPTLAEIDAEISRRQLNAGPSIAEIDAEIARRQSVGKQDSFFRSPSEALSEATGLADAALSIGAAALGEPIAGVSGIVASGFGELTKAGAGAKTVEAVRDVFTLEPSTEKGRENLQVFAKAAKPIADLLQSAEKLSGDLGFDIAGPIGGAIGATLPTALAEALGLKGVRVGKRLAGTEISEDAASVISSGERLNVPVLTSDVQPPTTFIGKFTQQLSEKMGPLGSGATRAKQQVARQNVVEELGREFDVELDSTVMADVVKSLNEQTARDLANASQQRNRAVDELVTFGDVPLTDTFNAIDQQIARQARLGDKGDSALVSNLENIKSSIQGDFALVKDIRTEVIDDVKALRKSEDSRGAGSLVQVKQAIDRDMKKFAEDSSPIAARDWRESNLKFFDELQKTRETELKRILNKGDATPEIILPLLKGGKRSELSRLNDSLTPEGRASARAAIITDALDESGFMRGEINPDRLATALGRTKRKQAIDVFFTGTDKKQLDGLVRLLNATRRAQQSAAAPATGIQTIPLLTTGGIGAGIATNPIATFGAVSSLTAIAKGYESKAFRTLLLKIANSKKGSKIETGLLESAVPAVIAGLQATKKEQEQTELEQ